MTQNLNSEWATEINSNWPDQAFSLKIKNCLVNKSSGIQKIQVYETESIWKKVLFLDGIIQFTDTDEFVYQEMMANIPLMTYPNFKKVLIVGGGDGGILREICRYETVEEVHLCEIDADVINISKKYFPKMSCAFDNPKLKLHIMDAFHFLKEFENYFDIIICDSSDPIGPAKILFEKNFYELCFTALKDDGIFVTQMENIWINIDYVREKIDMALSLFTHVNYAQLFVPTYTCGVIGMLCCSKTYDCSKIPMNTPAPDLRYYTPEIHQSSFILPAFAKKKLFGS